MSRRKIHSEKVERVEVSCQRSIAVESAEHILPEPSPAIELRKRKV